MKFRPTEFLNTPYRVSCYIKLYRKLFSCMRPGSIVVCSLLQVVEGAAGVVVGAFHQVASQYQGQKVVLLMCGANIATDKLRSIINEYHND